VAEFDADVLVVGTGPMGATTALALATYGVRVHADGYAPLRFAQDDRRSVRIVG
jgi:2-polyprenyl-6-methoxyphenol hydroxylase-like FAD-dependent oxidoreductase